MAEIWFFDVLPYHPPPYPGECLSGYLLRLAQVNQTSSFWNLIGDLLPMLQQSRRLSLLQWEYPVDDWGDIPLRTQLPVVELKKLTVASLLEKFRPLPSVKYPKYLSPDRFLRKMVTPGLQVCPLCLQAQPYLRLMWRMSPIQVCLDHHCLLQAQCSHCRAPLTVVGPTHRHLQCATCNADLRTLPVIAAPAEILATQHRRQAELQFLLNPGAILVQDPTGDPRAAIGRKFRYLRFQIGQTGTELSQKTGLHCSVIYLIEKGSKAVPVHRYVTYLESLSISWSDFALLEVPANFEQDRQQLPLLHLRLCPTVDCPNHLPPPNTHVHLIVDYPDQQKAFFRCTTCGRRFTRTYDGKLLTTKSRQPRIRPEKLPSMLKPDDQVARLTELGLQGMSTSQTARELGWTYITVRNYWTFLGLADQVHQAQLQRRDREMQDRRAALRERVKTIVQSFLSQDEEITLRRVGRALGYDPNYLSDQPDLREWVQEVAQMHKAQVRQRQCSALSETLSHLIKEAQQSNTPMTIQGIVKQTGLSYAQLCDQYPELYPMVRQAVQEHQARIKNLRLEMRCVEINEAAARLVSRGVRLTYKALLEEAGLHLCKSRLDPVIQELLRQWVGNFAPGD